MAEIAMTEAAREAKRQYHRRWRKKNPERVASAQARYWERQADKLAAEVEEREKEGGEHGE